MPVDEWRPEKVNIPNVGRDYVPPSAMPIYVGGKDRYGNDWNWATLAALASMSAADVIRYNYKTTVPEVVNFYLKQNCGCKLETADGKNYRFPGASPGVVYIPAIVPIINFFRIPIQPMDMRQADPGRFAMSAVFQVHLTLNPALPDPSLYEYRQEICGSAFQQDGTWTGDSWTPIGLLRMVPRTAWRVPGGLWSCPRWIEDGTTDSGTGNRHYGHRENGNHRNGLEVDEYRPGPLTGNTYSCTDQPGLEGAIVIGQRTILDLDFLGTVVRFDKPPSDTSRKILETVAKRTWSYRCTRTIQSALPLTAV